MLKKITFIFGTRPEAIKLAPLIKSFQQYPLAFTVTVIVTGQQDDMVDQVLGLFQIKPDYDLKIMTFDQTLGVIASKVLAGLEDILVTNRPDMVIVQGDTATASMGALAAFYHKVPVAHVEAGLRTGDRFCPFPEEINRRLISVLADLHFVATVKAGENLLREGVAREAIWVTGNTVIDALFWVLKQPYQSPSHLTRLLKREKAQRILVTVHRRENHGKPLKDICQAILEILRVMPSVEVIFPVHPSPRVQGEVMSLLQNNKRIHLLAPLNYQEFVHVMQSVQLVLTDSGGIQEEAPSLGVPVLVLRERTERPEAILAGTVRMVGTNPGVIVQEVRRVLLDKESKAMTFRVNPYGNGQACPAVVGHIARHLGVPVPLVTERVSSRLR